MRLQKSRSQTKRATREWKKPHVASKTGIKNELLKADAEYDNLGHARRHARDSIEYDFPTVGNSRQRVLVHYTPIHIILHALAKNNIKGKKILHMGGSTGVYARFLEEKNGAMVVNLDKDPVSLKDAKKRGGKRQVLGDAIPKEEPWDGISFAENRRGLMVPSRRKNHLPFADKSFDFVISDNFLYSDYHRYHSQDVGFEEAVGSFKKSEETLSELNRVMRKNGRVIIGYVHGEDISHPVTYSTAAHPPKPLFVKYKKGFQIHGFLVEEALGDSLARVRNPLNTRFMILRKIKEDSERERRR